MLVSHQLSEVSRIQQAHAVCLMILVSSKQCSFCLALHRDPTNDHMPVNLPSALKSKALYCIAGHNVAYTTRVALLCNLRPYSEYPTPNMHLQILFQQIAMWHVLVGKERQCRLQQSHKALVMLGMVIAALEF